MFIIENNMKKEKKAQVSIFIIIALLLVIVLILIFFRRDIFTAIQGKAPIEQIKDCARAYTKEAVDLLSAQGGVITPVNYYVYNKDKIEYLCYSANYYERCIMQKPFLKQDIEKEITNYISPRIKECMKGVKSDMEKNGYSVSLGDIETHVQLVPSSILIQINSGLTISKESTESYKSIKTEVPSKLYDLVIISSASIANWEARYGDSESLNYMLYYPQLKVEKKLQGDGTTVYILTDRNTLDKFVFASRSVALPPGLTGV
jgi:hypothetical protein